MVCLLLSLLSNSNVCFLTGFTEYNSVKNFKGECVYMYVIKLGRGQ